MAWYKCIDCKEPIWLPDAHDELLRRNGATFHCLWGHKQVFAKGKTDLQKMTEERDALIRQRDLERQRAARLAEERDAADRRASAARGQVTKLKNRAAAGVCPCCNRTFVQLARHMASKHPDFATKGVAQ